MPDPNMLWYPESCATIIKQDRPGPVVRAGTTHAQALLEFVKAPHAAGASPPPGFAAAPGSSLGLPVDLGRLPGSTLQLGRNIFNAFDANTGDSGELLGPLESLPILPAYQTEQRFNPHDLARQLIEARADGNVWDIVEGVRTGLINDIAEEKRLNAKLGLPGPINFNDIWDPYGRQYRAAVEATPEWNRPELPDLPLLGKNGEWQSVSTLALKALEEIAPQETEKETEAWKCIALGGGKRGDKLRVVDGAWSGWSKYLPRSRTQTRSNDTGYESWE
ncbi:hypothetical protein CLAFUW4_09866 [Fulvia fulva]|uniref:Uncharacterized protein n=1 Tax=Passalora fulva TaxID=5499 RepID=A0A9Q8PHK9_PASFU|nr:uncharacterized protein CLAFUR5_12373 [Fulvia fulva]KAK4615737.1 hypothetical protein CLAFUR4_09872 [Fulvia fulva]KAK4617398.1 hypothetical protein CLAFUR0_09865 [Fulvia fulva]UJO22618.1 hypothetical protein CLAFUR5_12373 [Fulvia fulva]WPV19229.1 hypothetical protein CLAFUW4_09866 [Fulvia fulva]WPV34292.1 hypothetical protein CLAFUW7_09869 [Fulvia fulva]